MHLTNICVLGGTGFVGSCLVNALHDAGKRVRVLTRRRERHKALLVLPKVEVVECDIHDPQVLAAQFREMDAVINLVAILNERGPKGEEFRHVHVELTKKVVQACLDCGVRRLLHMSALHADAGRGTSLYLRSKGEAENHAHTFAGNRLAVTSFRPSVIFGPGDGLFRRFAALLRISPILPLACPNARFAPVYVGDVVAVMCNALEDDGTIDQHFDLCGPEVFTLREIVAYTAQVIGRHRLIIGLPDWLSRAQAAVLERLPGKLFTRDNYDSMQTDSVCDKAPAQPTRVSTVVPGYLARGSRDDLYQSWRRTANR
ncbi:MAG: complex I NDUFA9 subunit family protein [Gammaproteobacteria bacterium]|nr:complex I NDUFA9 subunit family protein [Gammaproteobacteria bacterium]